MSYKYPPKPTEHGRDLYPPIHNDTYPAINPTTASNLSNRTIFITGASKGIGRATALSYARAGATQIAVGARSDLSSVLLEIASAAKGAGHPAPHVLSLILDVQDASSVARAASETAKTFGRLDVLINNAGYLPPSQNIADSNIDEYWTTWDINYKGLYLVTRALLPLLKGTEGGLKTIINVSSSGAHGLRPGMSAYMGSKFAVCRFSEFICTENAEEGVVAYSVHPGGVPTELALGMRKEMHSILVDTPELGADTMVFLTQERRVWLAGRYVSVRWDMPTFFSKKEEIVEGDKLKLKLIV